MGLCPFALSVVLLPAVFAAIFKFLLDKPICLARPYRRRGGDGRARLAAIVGNRSRPFAHTPRPRIVLHLPIRLPVLEMARRALGI